MKPLLKNRRPHPFKPFRAYPESPSYLKEGNLFIYFYLFYFICHTIITKSIGKEEKKKWRGDLTEAIGAYERLGLLEL